MKLPTLDKGQSPVYHIPPNHWFVRELADYITYHMTKYFQTFWWTDIHKCRKIIRLKPQSQLAVRYWWSYVCCGFWWSWSLAGSARVTYVYRCGQLPVAIVVAIQQPPYVLTGTVRSIKIVWRPCVSRTIFTKKMSANHP
jgi:hypothetical protein